MSFIFENDHLKVCLWFSTNSTDSSKRSKFGKLDQIMVESWSKVGQKLVISDQLWTNFGPSLDHYIVIWATCEDDDVVSKFVESWSGKPLVEPAKHTDRLWFFRPSFERNRCRLWFSPARALRPMGRKWLRMVQKLAKVGPKVGQIWPSFDQISTKVDQLWTIIRHDDDMLAHSWHNMHNIISA